MSHTVSIKEVSAQLDQLLSKLGPGDEIVLTRNDQRIARIVPDSVSTRPRQAGACKGMLEIIDDSDDVILEHFKDYMP